MLTVDIRTTLEAWEKAAEKAGVLDLTEIRRLFGRYVEDVNNGATSATFVDYITEHGTLDAGELQRMVLSYTPSRSDSAR